MAVLPCLCLRATYWPFTTTYEVAQQAMGVNCGDSRSASTRVRLFSALSTASYILRVIAVTISATLHSLPQSLPLAMKYLMSMLETQTSSIACGGATGFTRSLNTQSTLVFRPASRRCRWILISYDERQPANRVSRSGAVASGRRPSCRSSCLRLSARAKKADASGEAKKKTKAVKTPTAANAAAAAAGGRKTRAAAAAGAATGIKTLADAVNTGKFVDLSGGRNTCLKRVDKLGDESDGNPAKGSKVHKYTRGGTSVLVLIVHHRSIEVPRV